MNKQTKTYLLLVLVLCIWGAVAYQIYAGLNREPELPESVVLPKTASLNLAPSEPFEIRADYRDPFLGTLPPKKTTLAVAPKQIPNPWEGIEVAYTGSMEGGQSGRLYFVTLRGSQLVFQKGKSLDGFTLIDGSQNRITLIYEGHRKSFNRVP